jgi:hypothetical protein
MVFNDDRAGIEVAQISDEVACLSNAGNTRGVDPFVAKRAKQCRFGKLLDAKRTNDFQT